LNKRYLIIFAIVATIIIIVAFYYLFVVSSPAIVRLVTRNPPVEGGLILPQNEKRNWDPDVIELTVGVPATLVIVNNDDVETHQFAIPELNVLSDPIPPFESISFEFTPNMTGSFTFIDSRPEETYTYVDYRGITVNQVVDHSVETGRIIVNP
jgi:heme/copper-type cytochrome/quinol oxidase subunit 2